MSTHQAALNTDVLAPHAGPEPATLFSPYRLGDLELRNRLVMSPSAAVRSTATFRTRSPPPTTPSAPPPA